MILLGARVDALTVAFRVELDETLVEELRARRERARLHGRAMFEWTGMHDRNIADASRVLPSPLVGSSWRDLAELRPILGEIRGGGELGRYLVKREPSENSHVGYRLLVLEHGPGSSRMVHDVTGEIVEEPGWTVEIVWYAETLAVWGVDRCLAQSAMMAWQMGRVFEQAVRRFDLCADVSGWEIHPDDAVAIVKRPRASYDVASDASELDELGGRARRRGAPTDSEARGTTSHEAGKPGARKVCGLSIGAGGSLMARLYNKALELSLAGRERKRALEHARWRDNGWDGHAPVTRVEFQIRGAAIRELGLRDPEAIREAVIDEATGKARGHVVMRHDDGRAVTLSERLPWVWCTMLRWVRLVVPDPKQRFSCRLETQWRWRFLELVSFGELPPLRRVRVRGRASEAQALGVALGNAAKAGELDAVAWARDERWEDPRSYVPWEAKDVLEQRVRALAHLQHARIVAWLIDRAKGDAIEANVHLAHAARAKWARHADWEAFRAEYSEPNDRPALSSRPPRSGPTSDPFADWPASLFPQSRPGDDARPA